MSIITEIDDVPLFTTREEAVAWGESYNLSGYHAHAYNDQVGYMGGENHSEATKRLIRKIEEERRKEEVVQLEQPVIIQQPEQQDTSEDLLQQPTIITTPTQTPSPAPTGGGSSYSGQTPSPAPTGGGGGY